MVPLKTCLSSAAVAAGFWGSDLSEETHNKVGMYKLQRASEGSESALALVSFSHRKSKGCWESKVVDLFQKRSGILHAQWPLATLASCAHIGPASALRPRNL